MTCPWPWNLPKWKIQNVRTSYIQHLENSLKTTLNIYSLEGTGVVGTMTLLFIKYLPSWPTGTNKSSQKNCFPSLPSFLLRFTIHFKISSTQIINSCLLQWSPSTLNSLRFAFTSKTLHTIAPLLETRGYWWMHQKRETFKTKLCKKKHIAYNIQFNNHTHIQVLIRF